MRKSGNLIMYYTKNAIDVMYDTEKKEDRFEKFVGICQSVLFSMNAYDNYFFAVKVSMCMQDEFKRYFPIDQFEKKVLAENDDMLSYLFAENVIGSDANKFAKYIKNEELKAKVEKLLKVVNDTMEA